MVQAAIVGDVEISGRKGLVRPYQEQSELGFVEFGLIMNVEKIPQDR
ncbi:hypothetical protein [Mesorhizobium sp. CAU 1732]